MTTQNQPQDRAHNLLGKVALVTGGSRGIGKGIVERLARDGAAVAFTYAGAKDRADALVAAVKAEGGRALAIQADAADAAATKIAVARTVEAFGGLDILVNNAGVLQPGMLGDVTLEDLDRQIAVNVRGVFVATQEAARHMKAGGRIIHIGSVNSDFMPFPGASVYALTKGAVAGLTHGLARELGARGITVNNVQPGPVNTDMNPHDGPLAATLAPLLGLGRYGDVREVAALVAFLASAEGGYVNGASLKVDGGFTA
jgi:3-oxoacyl-[acyl-carrier protein] reductase